MAAPSGQSDSEMDLDEHRKTWIGFTTFIKWSIAAAGAVMILLALFRTNG